MSLNTYAPVRTALPSPLLAGYPISIPAAIIPTLDKGRATDEQTRKLRDELFHELAEFELGRARALWRTAQQASAKGEFTFGVADFLIRRTIAELRQHREIKKALDVEFSSKRSSQLPDGRYALATEDGFAFYHLTTGRRTRSQRVYRYHSDSRQLLSLRQGYQVRQAILSAGIEASTELFKAQSRRCIKCGKRLTDTQLAATHGGYGPECVKKV